MISEEEENGPHASPSTLPSVILSPTSSFSDAAISPSTTTTITSSEDYSVLSDAVRENLSTRESIDQVISEIHDMRLDSQSANEHLFSTTSRDAIPREAIPHVVYFALNDICQEMRHAVTSNQTYNAFFDEWQTRFLRNAKQALALSCPNMQYSRMQVGRLSGEVARGILASLLVSAIITQRRYEAMTREALKRLALRLFALDGRRFKVLEQSLLFTSSEAASSPSNESLSSLLSTTTSNSISSANSKRSNATSTASTVDRVKYWAKVGAGAAVGALAVGLTGGALAPALAALIGTAASTAALTLGGIGAAGFAGYKVARRIGSVSDFAILNVLERDTASSASSTSASSTSLEASSQLTCLRPIICISGWLQSRKDVTRPWKPRTTAKEEDSQSNSLIRSAEGELMAVQFERGELLALGHALKRFLASSVATAAAQEVLKRTVLAGAAAALVWPLTLLQAGGAVVDNPWSIGLDRARKTGVILAGILIQQDSEKNETTVEEERSANSVILPTPVSLIGFSLGALVIYECLLELERKGAFGIVHSVVLMGLPARFNPEAMTRARSVVSGRFLHVFSRNDWVLGFLHRTANATFTGEICGMIPLTSTASLSKRDTYLETAPDGGGDRELAAVLTSIDSIEVTAAVRGHLEYSTIAGEFVHFVDL